MRFSPFPLAFTVFFVVFTPKKDGVRNSERSIGKIPHHWYEIARHDNSIIAKFYKHEETINENKIYS